MQLMPATAARFGVRDVWDPEDNSSYIRNSIGRRPGLWPFNSTGLEGRPCSLASCAPCAGERSVGTLRAQSRLHRQGYAS